MGDSKHGSAVERAEAALREGRPWQARDRAAGCLAQRPADQQVLELLARAWFELGDLPRAGRYWYLTAVDSAEAHAAREAFRSAHDGEPVEMAYALKVRAPLSSWPEAVQQRLQALASAVEASGHGWMPGHPPRLIVEPGNGDSRWGWIAVPLIVVATVGIWLFGLVAILRLILF